MTLNVAIAGASGRMGRELLQAVHQDPNAQTVCALDRAGNPFIGQDAGMLIGAPSGVTVRDDFATALQGADVLIDFTRPEGTLAHLEA